MIACKLALDDAGLGDPAARSFDVGVTIGSYTAGLHSVVAFLDGLNAQGPAGASAMDFSNTVGNAAASLCAIEHGLRGPNATLNYKEASGLAAVAYAMTAGISDTTSVVTGGVDDFESAFFTIYDRFKVLARDTGGGEASRPFDRDRNGLVLGSGAYLFVLETPEAAAQRGATIRATIAGIGATASSCQVNRWPVDPAELARSMREALASASVDPGDVGVVFASANSTALDVTEAQALAAVFGPRGVPVVAIKGAIGESGAAGAAAVIAASASLRRGVIPPSIGCDALDPACEVDLSRVGDAPRTLERPVALVNSFASGGTNYSVVIRP